MDYLHLCIFLKNNIFIVKSICIMELVFENTLDWLSYFSIPLWFLSGEFYSTNPDLVTQPYTALA